MKFISQKLRQRAVLWVFTGVDDNGNTTVSSTPVEIKVRWEEGLVKSIGEDGEPIAVNTLIFVDRKIIEGGQLWKGRLRDLPSPVTNLHEVVDYQETPTINQKKTQRTVTTLKLKP
jgi:hypothetical protein